MRELFTKIRQWFCRHDWKMTRFQALIPGNGYRCTKCGKQEQFYPHPTGGCNHGE
jgi:hypothetical protein